MANPDAKRSETTALPRASALAPRAAAVAAFAVSTLLLLAPALWNRFPLLQWDTGGYLARWYEGTLVVSRSTVYGGLLYLLQAPNFWPVALVQSALATWVIALVLRTFGLARPRTLALILVALTAFTALPWLTSILLTDIFAGLAVLVVYLLTFAWGQLTRAERAGLFALAAIATGTHSATLLLVLGLAAAGLVFALLRPALLPAIRLWPAALSCVTGAVLLVACNYAVAGRIAWTPGGTSILCARMLEDGIVQRYLAEHCDRRPFRLCRYREQLPNNADEFLWGGGRNSVFNRLGRFAGLETEMEVIALESLVLYPGMQLKAALSATARQLVTVGSGEGVVTYLPHTVGIIDRFTPRSAEAMRAARQQTGGLTLFPALNLVQVPIALGSVLGLLVIAVHAGRARRFGTLEALAVTILLAVVFNAAICGVFSNPHPRYGARIAWLAPFVMLMLLALSAQSQVSVAQLRNVRPNET